MAKKSIKAKTRNYQETKPPSIEKARDALLSAVACWLEYVSDDPVMPYPKTLDVFLKHADRLGDLDHYWLQLLLADDEEGSWTDRPKRPFDSVLDIKTGYHDETAIEVIAEISHLVRRLKSNATIRETVIQAVKQEGLPSTRIEARGLLNKVTFAMRTPESNEKYPGLKQTYMKLKDKGCSWKEIASQYVDSHYGRGVEGRKTLVDSIVAHMKYNVHQKGAWPDKLNPK